MASQAASELVDKAENPDDRVRRLLLGGGEKKLSPRVRAAVLELNSAAIPALLQILEEDELSMADAPGEGWAPLHAAELLAELKVTGAVAPMIRILARTDPLDALHDHVLGTLGELGEAAVEPALKAYAESSDTDFQDSLCAVLVKTGVKDERIFAGLRRQLSENLEMGASHLAEYGDPRALPDLSRAFDRYHVVDSDRLFTNHAVVELRAAIEELGGTLTANQRAKLERATQIAERLREQLEAPPASRRRKIGRNEPCPCGSGKKYKKCHLASDKPSEA